MKKAVKVTRIALACLLSAALMVNYSSIAYALDYEGADTATEEVEAEDTSNAAEETTVESTGEEASGTEEARVTLNSDDPENDESENDEGENEEDNEDIGGSSGSDAESGKAEEHFIVTGSNKDGWTVEDNVIAITGTGTYTITGDSADDHDHSDYDFQVTITGNITVDVTLNNVQITNTSGAAMYIDGEATVTLKLEGTNSFTSPTYGYAGIQFSSASTGSLTITSDSNDNSLTAIGNGGAGIGGAVNLTGNNITIKGGTITATSLNRGAGIGGGRWKGASNIEITGGIVTAQGGTFGAGIGGGSWGVATNIKISGGDVTATGGYRAAGIGGGGDGGSAYNITISGGTVTATGGYAGTGIGSGRSNHSASSPGYASNIAITGGTVIATGSYGAAGIGVGRYGVAENITISGGTVTATGGYRAAGIGSGLGNASVQGSVTGITISGGTVTATGGSYSAGIGSGQYSTASDIKITGGIITASGGSQAIGTGSSFANISSAINYSTGGFCYRTSASGLFTYASNTDAFTPATNYLQIYPGFESSFNPSSLTTYVDETLGLAGNFSSDQSFDSYTWVSDSDCVTVDSDGNIEAVSAGSATVTVTALSSEGMAVASIGITVEKGNSTISFEDGFSLDKTYNGQAVSVSVDNVTRTGSTGNVDFTWDVQTGDNSWEPIDGAPTDVGTYRVTAHVEEDANYNAASSDALIFEITQATPTASDFTFTAPNDTEYDANAKEVSVIVADGISGMGEIVSVEYSSDGGATWTEEAPVYPGTYLVRITVIEGTNYTEVTLESDEWTFSITKSGWTRLWGDDRYETMVEVVKEAFGDDSSNYVVIASGQNFADSLTASSLAGVLDAPIILVSGSLTADTIAQIERVGATQAYIVGGPASVSASVATQIASIAGIENVERVSGDDRYATAVAVAEKTASILADQGKTLDTVILASGAVYADALSISPYAYTTGTPIILVGSNGLLGDASADWIESSDATSLIVAGGTASVANGAITQTGISSTNSERLAGSDRYATSVAIANWAIANGDLSANGAVVASGTTFPDALAASALCGQFGSVLLLASDSSTVATSVISAYADSITYAYFVGGPASISATVANTFVSASNISLND